jgi:hypothetical protein
VRLLAETLITDDTKSPQDTQQRAAELGGQLRSELSPSEQWEQHLSLSRQAYAASGPENGDAKHG